MAETAGEKAENLADSWGGFGGGLLHIILGALILWVGQTTYEQSGQLASFENKFVGIQRQFDTVREGFAGVDKRQEELREQFRLELSEVDQRTGMRFTSQDGDKLENRIIQLADRLTAVQLKVMAIEASNHSEAKLTALRTELAELQGALGQSAGLPQASRMARGGTHYLPPVSSGR